MEPVVYEETPLADYLRDGGDGSDVEWANASDRGGSSSSSPSLSLPPSPTPFAPSGRPAVKARFRKKPYNLYGTAHPPALPSIKRNYSAAVAASIDRADNAKFLEKFRYTIVASQLLSGHSMLGPPQAASDSAGTESSGAIGPLYSTEGIMASVLGALALAVVLSWVLGSSSTYVTRKRFVFLLVIIAAGVLLGKVHMRRQWLRYRREQSLSEITSFISISQEFDGASGAALSLVQEVELVSRGYRISLPLAPASRMEERTQSRKCIRLRKALRNTFTEMLDTYIQVSAVVKGFSEHTDLEKYLDIYEISDFDISDANRGFDPDEFDDVESLRTLKIVASRFQTIRRIFLCSLLALDASGEGEDLLQWTAAVEALRNLNAATNTAFSKLRDVLAEEESFPPPQAPKSPLTPGRERWRSQLHKLNSLGTGIRGLQAKLQLLREESDRALNDSSDLSELAPNLMGQYDSIGADLKELMAAWEEGKAALAQGIDRNEKRLSSMSTLISPTTSLSGLTTVEEEGKGDSEAALKALTGGSPTRSENEEPEREVFEAVALPRPRSMLTREERITKMREDREQKAQARQQMDATRGMLKELETVISLRPRNRMSAPPGRVASL